MAVWFYREYDELMLDMHPCLSIWVHEWIIIGYIYLQTCSFISISLDTQNGVTSTSQTLLPFSEASERKVKIRHHSSLSVLRFPYFENGNFFTKWKWTDMIWHDIEQNNLSTSVLRSVCIDRAILKLHY